MGLTVLVSIKHHARLVLCGTLSVVTESEQQPRPLLDQRMVRRIESGLAISAARIAQNLMPTTGTSPSEVFELGGGTAILMGPGFYVNRLIGSGLAGTVDQEVFDQLEAASSRVGVPSQIQLCPWADGSLVDLAAERHYRVTALNATMYRTLGPRLPSQTGSGSRFAIRLIDDDSLPDWQATVAAAHKLTTSAQREMSDAFAAAAFHSAGEAMYLASDATGPVATASLTMVDGLAILGGMATVPSTRRQGHQLALIQRRLGDAFTFGADIAVTTAASGGGSQRNLLRAGFQVAYTQVILSQT